MSSTAISSVQWMEAEGAAVARGLRRRDPDVIDRLIEQYQHRLLRYLLYLTSNRELAEDCFQETWMRVLERGAQYNGKLRFDTWLFAIARHLVIDLSRRKNAVSLDALLNPATDDFAPLQLQDCDPTPFEVTFRRELGRHLTGALVTLDVTQREVIILRFQEEMSLEEIAQVTGIPLSTVKSRLYRGLMAMRPTLEKSNVKAAHA